MVLKLQTLQGAKKTKTVFMQSIIFLFLFLFSLFSINAQTPGSTLRFDGTNDHVNIGTAIPILLDPLNVLTVEAWIRPSVITGSGTIVGNSGTSTANMQFLLRRVTNTCVFSVDDGTGVKTVSTAAASIAVNVWYHIAGVWDGSEIRIYLNGVLANTTTGVTGTDFRAETANPIYIGSSGATARFGGRLDEIRIWSRALTLCEITNNMNCEIATTGTNLLANYHFNNGTASGTNTGLTTLADASGNGYNGTLTNFTLTGSTSNWVAPGAVTTGMSCSPLVLPTISSVTGTTSVCSGSSTTLTANSAAPSPVFNWYDAVTGGTLLFTGASYVTPMLTMATTYYVDVTSSSCTSSPRTTVAVTLSSSEINVKGNSASIVDGDLFPSSFDATTFSSVGIGGTTTKTYTIENTGMGSLDITGITFTGTNASEFTVTTPPASTVAASSSTTFIVTFQPTAAGARTATINIANNDCSEAVYNYAITGSGTLLANSITMAAIPKKFVNDLAFTITATATSGGVVTFSGSDSSIAVVSAAGLITPVAAGSIYVYAYHPGDATYKSATLKKIFLVVKRSQTITWSAITSKNVFSPDFSVTATASTGFAITYSVVSGPATITGNMVHLLGTGGTVILRATQAGDNIYLSKYIDKFITVAKSAQTITWTAIPSKTTASPDFMVSATASSGLGLTYSVLSGPATISGNTVHLLGTTGLVKLRATQSGNETYLAKTADQTFTVVSAMGMPGNGMTRMYYDNEETTAIKNTIQATIYPNPTNGLLNIHQNEAIQEIIVFDILGNSTFKVNTEGNNNVSIDLSNLAKGIYYVRIKSNDGFNIQKVTLK